jgi:hypothetical protein
MIRAILWKEWREHRAKYLAYWVVLNAPILLVAFAVAVSTAARTPFADLSNSTVLKYLPLALAEPLLLSTAFLTVTGLLAVATFYPELEDRSVFFVYEQPVPRTRYVAIKVLIGGFHVACATFFATVFAAVAAYGILLASGKVTVAGSSEALRVVMAASLRGAMWCALISLVAFTLSALVSAVAPRAWLAAVGSVAVTILLIVVGHNYFDYTSDIPDGESASVNMGFSSGSSQWLTVSRPMTLPEVAGFAHWRTKPFWFAVLLAIVLCFAIAQVYRRKELR